MIFYVLAGLVGLALGSFLNVVITRLPRKDRVWAGRSRCPYCQKVLPWYDNIPLLSYMRLRGRCRFCGTSIPYRYPLVEFSGCLLALLLWHQYPFNPILLAYTPFSMALLALSVIDLEYRLLPDAITLPGLVLGLILALVLPHISFLDAASGAVLGGSLLYGVGWIYQKLRGRLGLGGGDVKLIAMIGAFLGASSIPLLIFLSAAMGCLAGVVLALTQGRYRSGQWQSLPIPYGPFLAAAAVFYLLAGENLLRILGGV